MPQVRPPRLPIMTIRNDMAGLRARRLCSRRNQPFRVRASRPGLFWEWIPDMRPYRRFVSSARRRISLQAEALEHRTLSERLVGLARRRSWRFRCRVPTSASKPISSTSRSCARGCGPSRSLGPLTVDFSASTARSRRAPARAADVARAAVHPRQRVGHVPGGSDDRNGRGSDQFRGHRTPAWCRCSSA